MGTEGLLLALSFATLLVAIIGSFYALLSYKLKSGIDVRAAFSMASSIGAPDKYISEVTLENLKDRAVVIFKILLEVDRGYLIQLEDFEEEPLILKPFEAVRRHYQPIDFYSVNIDRIRMNNLLEQRKTRRRLVLSTSQGRYNVGNYIESWHPVQDTFRNHLTALIYPVRSTVYGASYGSRTKYVVVIKTIDGTTETIPIYPRDYEVRKFRGFLLTPESLQSRDALETFLLERAIEGELRCSDVTVLDMEEWRQEIYSDYNSEPLAAVPRSWFTYHVLGWILTKWNNLELARKNHLIRARHRERLRERQAASKTNDCTT